MKNKKNNLNIGLKLLIMSFGAVFLAIGIYLMRYSVDFKKAEKEFNKNAEPIEVYVNKVYETSHGSGADRRTSYSAYVTYELNGKTYSNIYISDSAGAGRLHEGKKMVIYHHKDNPTWLRAEMEDDKIVVSMSVVAGVFLAIIGCLIIIAGLFGKESTPEYMEELRNRKLVKNGKRIDAQVTNIIEEGANNNTTQKGYYVECQILDGASGIYMKCKSRLIYDEVPLYNLKTVPVYINPNNNNEYAMNVYGALAEIKNSEGCNVLDYRY